MLNIMGSQRTIWKACAVSLGLVLIAFLLTATNFLGQAGLWENVHWTLAAWGMAALGFLGWRSAEGRVRRIRGLMTIGLVSYAIGQILWDVEWLSGSIPFPAPSDIFYLGIAPFLLTGIALTFTNRLSRGELLVLRVDSAITFIAFSTLIFALYGPRSSTLTLIQTVVLIAYPVVFLATSIVVLISTLVVKAQIALYDTPYVLLFGLAGSGICWVIWNSLALDMVLPPGLLVGYGFSISHFVVGLGVAFWNDVESGNPRYILWSKRILWIFPLIGTPIAVIALEWGRSQAHNLMIPIVVGGISVILLSSLRQSILLWERENLLVRERSALQRAEQELVERKKVEDEREELIKELENRNVELEQFTYTVSHDLKSPLVTIQGFLGYVEKHAQNGDMEKLTTDSQRIKAAVSRMQLLLNELLELSRIGRLMNPPTEIPFTLIIQEALGASEGLIKKRGVQINVHDNFPVVNGDRTRLVEVVQNLVDNAVKFMGDQPNPRIEIGMATHNGFNSPMFYVSDNGIGIDPEYHDQVFGLFNKLSAKSDGTGVGLALVKRIVEFHGGKIWVESEGVNKGTRFCFTLE